MAWTILDTANDYKIAEESLTVPDSAGANVTTAESATINDDLSNKKFVVFLEVTETSAGDGAFDIKIQGSHDESTWTDLDATVGLDIDPTGTNKGAAVADLSSNTQAPYYRIQVFSDGTDILDSATVTVAYAVKP